MGRDSKMWFSLSDRSQFSLVSHLVWVTLNSRQVGFWKELSQTFSISYQTGFIWKHPFWDHSFFRYIVKNISQAFLLLEQQSISEANVSFAIIGYCAAILLFTCLEIQCTRIPLANFFEFINCFSINIFYLF